MRQEKFVSYETTEKIDNREYTSLTQPLTNKRTNNMQLFMSIVYKLLNHRILEQIWIVITLFSDQLGNTYWAYIYRIYVCML